MKITNKRELQQIVVNHLSVIDFKEFMKIYKKCTVEKYYFLVLVNNTSRRLEKATCTSSLPGKAFEKQTKTIEEIGA